MVIDEVDTSKHPKLVGLQPPEIRRFDALELGCESLTASACPSAAPVFPVQVNLAVRIRYLPL